MIVELGAAVGRQTHGLALFTLPEADMVVDQRVEHSDARLGKQEFGDRTVPAVVIHVRQRPSDLPAPESVERFAARIEGQNGSARQTARPEGLALMDPMVLDRGDDARTREPAIEPVAEARA